MVKQDEINGYFLAAVRWLKSEYGYTQEYIVEKAELAQNTISKIKTGKANAGDETITKLCNAFDLDPDYFYGRSPYKNALEKKRAKLDVDLCESQELLEKIPPAPYIDPASQLNASISAYVQLTNRLEDDLKAKQKEMESRLADKETVIAEKEARIVELKAVIADKDARIIDLQRQLAAAQSSDITKYPFAIGAAEHGENFVKK